MSNHRWIKIVCIGLLMSLMIAISIISVRGQGLQPVSPEDAQAIEATIIRRVEVEAVARYTLDEHGLAEIYVNDLRGGKLDEKDLVLIQYIRQNKSLSLSDVGYLDYRQALILWLKQAIEKKEAILATMQAESRDYYTPDELASLKDETGRSATAADRGPDPATITPYIAILSLEMDGDVATVIVEYGMFKAEHILVKVDGRWYIAGGRTLEITG